MVPAAPHSEPGSNTSTQKQFAQFDCKMPYWTCRLRPIWYGGNICQFRPQGVLQEGAYINQLRDAFFKSHGIVQFCF